VIFSGFVEIEAKGNQCSECNEMEG